MSGRGGAQSRGTKACVTKKPVTKSRPVTFRDALPFVTRFVTPDALSAMVLATPGDEQTSGAREASTPRRRGDLRRKIRADPPHDTMTEARTKKDASFK